MKNIAFILPSLANKGPVIVAYEIVRYLVSQGVAVKVFYFDDIIELDFPCPVQRIKFSEKIDFSAFDVVHAHQLRPDIYVRKHRKKDQQIVLTTIHQDIKQDFRYTYNLFLANIFEFLWPRLLKKCDAVTFVAKYLQKKYEKVLKGKELISIYNGRTVVFEDISEEDKEKIAELKNRVSHVVGCVSVIIKRKGIDQLVEVLSIKKDWGLLIVGSGDELENLISAAKKLGVADRCLFLGYRKKGHRYYKYMDVCAFTSVSEGMSLSLIEAAASQRPIVCSDIQAYTDAFTDEEVAFYFQKNVVSLSDKLDFAWSQKERFIKNAFNKYQQSYTAEVMAENYFAFYKKLKKQQIDNNN